MRRVLKKMRNSLFFRNISLSVSFRTVSRFRRNLHFSSFFTSTTLTIPFFSFLFFSTVKLSIHDYCRIRSMKLLFCLACITNFAMGTRFWNRETESRGLERQPSVWKIGNAAISATDWFISSFVALLRKTVEAIQYLGPARWGYAFQWIWSSVVSTDFHSIRQTVVNQRNSSPSFNTFLASPLPVSLFLDLTHRSRSVSFPLRNNWTID